jgi:hypothetical protein
LKLATPQREGAYRILTREELSTETPCIRRLLSREESLLELFLLGEL